MKKLTTLILMVVVCGAVWGQITNKIGSTGNVGIGTSTPDNLLEIRKDRYGISLCSGEVQGLGFNRSVKDGKIFNSAQSAWQFTSRDERFTLEGYNGVSHDLLTFLKNGNVGIGTISPSATLDVIGSFKSNTLIINAPNSTDDWNTIWQCGFFDAYQKMNAPDSYNWYWGINLGHRSNNSGYRFGGQILIKNHPSEPVMYFRSRGNDGKGKWAKVLHNKGNQRIEGNLTVNGIFNSEEVKVETIAANNITYTANGNTADFVFEDNYHLKDLTEVEAFIKTNKHLPEIPSAAEMEEAGVNLAEMNKLLLMKVEELTLYAIEQKAEAERLKAEVSEVRSNESEVRSELEKEREERRAMRGEIKTQEERLAKMEALIEKLSNR